MTYTKTYVSLEPGKLYKVIRVTDLNNPKDNNKKNEFWNADNTFTIFEDEILMAISSEIEPEYGAWVLLGKRKLWLPGDHFDRLERI